MNDEFAVTKPGGSRPCSPLVTALGAVQRKLQIQVE
jgi:hypothetical protein